MSQQRETETGLWQRFSGWLRQGSASARRREAEPTAEELRFSQQSSEDVDAFVRQIDKRRQGRPKRTAIK